jgi:hypothetical protein
MLDDEEIAGLAERTRRVFETVAGA